MGISPEAIAVDPTTHKVYVANRDSNSVSVIDGTTGKVLSNNIRVGIGPTAIAVNPTTNVTYVANRDSNSVSVIDEAYIKGSTAANITVGISPTVIAVDPTTNMIYVANLDSNSVSVIDGTTDKVLSNNIGVQTDIGAKNGS
jgi:YVTN family beta-propeller protein